MTTAINTNLGIIAVAINTSSKSEDFEPSEELKREIAQDINLKYSLTKQVKTNGIVTGYREIIEWAIV